MAIVYPIHLNFGFRVGKMKIRDMCDTYGQKLLDLVYYCGRTYVYYIHREKQILLGKWPGDMTEKDCQTLTFRKTN